MNLGSVAAKGAAITLLLQGLRFIVQFAGLVVLGRLLPPSDFGLVAMVTAIIGIGDIIREFGLIPATVQASSLSKAQRSNLFWIGTGLGFFVAGVVCCLAPLLGLFYDDERVGVVALVLSMTFIFNGLQAQFQAGLAREMRFGAISLTDLAAQVSGLLTAVLFALAGWGYWALVLQLVVQSLTLLAFRASIARWIPGLPTRKVSVKAEITYGRSLVLTQMLVYASSNIDSVLVGSKYGPAQLGYYNRAFQLLMMPLNQVLTPLTTVALPVLAKINNEHERFNRYIQRAQLVVAYPIIVLFGFVAVAAEPLIRVIFGAQWLPSVPIFQILSVAGAFQAIGYVAYWVFLSKGLTASHFRFSLLSRAIFIVAILIGSVSGPAGVAIGYTFGAVLSWPLGLLWLRRAASLEIVPLILGGLRAIVLGVLCGAACLIPMVYIRVGNDILMILYVLGFDLAVAAIVLLSIPIYRHDLSKIIATGRLVTARGAKRRENVNDGTK